MHDLEHLYTPTGEPGTYPCSCPAHTPLDGLETSDDLTHTTGAAFRHSGWARLRAKVYAALIATERPASQISNFRACGNDSWIIQSKSDPTVIKIAASCCHHRFCLPCAQARARIIAANVAEYLPKGQLRFITLTLKQNKLSLTQNIERLYASFKKLRTTRLWKSTQRGGVAFLEVKRSRDKEAWNVHFHIVSQGKWMDGIHLGHTWREITGDSFIVDIRYIHDPNTVLQYITKYASKPFDPSLFELPDTLAEAITALEGRRMAVSFGNWKGLQMTDPPDKDAWAFLDTLEGIARRAAAGDSKAMAILRAACGERTEAVLARVARDVTPRMNLAPPPTPNPQTYLIEDSHQFTY